MMTYEEIISFLGEAATGKALHALVLTPNANVRKATMQRVFDMANDVGLNTTIASATHVVNIANSQVRVWVAYPYVDKAAMKEEFTSVHGLKYLDGFDKAEDMKGNILWNVQH